MTGVRDVVGFGHLTRGNNERVDELPQGKTPIDLLKGTELTNRFGGGVQFSSDINRSVNLINDIGLREATTVTQGISQGSFQCSGYFSANPMYTEWLKYALHISDSAEFTLTQDDCHLGKWSYVSGYNGEYYEFEEALKMKDSGEIDLDGGVLKLADDAKGQKLLYKVSFMEKDIKSLTPYAVCEPDTLIYYLNKINTVNKQYYDDIAKTYSEQLSVQIFKYKHMDTPQTFDIGWYQVNSTTDKGGMNVATILTGCTINDFSISYENGGDAAVQFSMSGYFLKPYTQAVTELFDYANQLDDPPESVLITGCVSKGTEKGFEAIAYTDHASVQCTNNVAPIADCGKITYGAYTIGTLDFSVDTSTWSNDPDKYAAAMYGFDKWANAEVHTLEKKPYNIKSLKVRSQNVLDVETDTATEFLDLNLKDNYVGGMSWNPAVNNVVMDDPQIRSKHMTIAVGFVQ